MANKKRGKNAVEELSRSKFRKIKNPNNNNNTVAAVENLDVQQEPTIEDLAAKYLELTRHKNQLLNQICKNLDLIMEMLLKKEKMKMLKKKVEKIS